MGPVKNVADFQYEKGHPSNEIIIKPEMTKNPYQKSSVSSIHCVRLLSFVLTFYFFNLSRLTNHGLAKVSLTSYRN